MLGVVREHAWIGLRKTESAAGARALGREMPDRRCFGHTSCTSRFECRRRLGDIHEYCQGALTMLQRFVDGLAQRAFVAWLDDQVAYRQFDRVFLVPVETRPGAHRYEFAVDAQVTVATRRRPFRQIGVIALARLHQ